MRRNAQNSTEKSSVLSSNILPASMMSSRLFSFLRVMPSSCAVLFGQQLLAIAFP